MLSSIASGVVIVDQYMVVDVVVENKNRNAKPF